jgi:chaperonin GroES
MIKTYADDAKVEKLKKEELEKKALPIYPLHKNVLIKLKEVDKQTKSGLILVNKSEEAKIQEGLVHALSNDPDVKLKVGDRVLFGQHAGVKIEVEGLVYLVLDYEEVIATIGEK